VKLVNLHGLHQRVFLVNLHGSPWRVRARLPARHPLLASSATYTALAPLTCVSTLVVKFVVVSGERNPASLAPSFRVRGRELERNPESLALSFQVRGRELEGKR